MTPRELHIYSKGVKDRQDKKFQRTLLVCNHLRPEDADPLKLEDIYESSASQDRSKTEVYNQIDKYEKIREQIEKTRESNKE